jgi:phospholipid/cholesterol/gamma-HCH transport system substrate-binding protein
LVSLGNIALSYRNDLEQLLVLFPQGTAVMSSIIVPDRVAKQDYKGIYLDFNLNLNSPPPCNTGFLPVQQQRIPVQAGLSRPHQRRVVLPHSAGLRHERPWCS